MSEETVKIELTVPAEIKRLMKAIGNFTSLDMNDYLVRCLTQGILDSLNPNCDCVKVLDWRAYITIKEKWGLDDLCEKVLDP